MGGGIGLMCENTVNFSAIAGMKELSSVPPGLTVRESCVWVNSLALDLPQDLAVLSMIVMNVPKVRPTWWNASHNGLIVHLEFCGNIRLQVEPEDDSSHELTFRNLNGGGVCMTFMCRGSGIRVRSSQCVLADFKSMQFERE